MTVTLRSTLQPTPPHRTLPGLARQLRPSRCPRLPAPTACNHRTCTHALHVSEGFSPVAIPRQPPAERARPCPKPVLSPPAACLCLAHPSSPGATRDHCPRSCCPGAICSGTQCPGPPSVDPTEGTGGHPGPCPVGFGASPGIERALPAGQPAPGLQLPRGHLLPPLPSFTTACQPGSSPEGETRAQTPISPGEEEDKLPCISEQALGERVSSRGHLRLSS